MKRRGYKRGKTVTLSRQGSQLVMLVLIVDCADLSGFIHCVYAFGTSRYSDSSV